MQSGDAASIRTVFGRMGFNDQETVALIGGGHTIGRTHQTRSGYSGRVWTPNPTQFSNEFYVVLLNQQWTLTTFNGVCMYMKTSLLGH
jgi:cytochrome c peroxidase